MDDIIGFSLWDSGLRTAIENLQWKLAQDLLILGHIVVLEWGTWGRSERDGVREGARALGAAVELDFLDAPVNVLFDRIRLRDNESPSITIKELLEWNSEFQRPGPDEMSLFDCHEHLITVSSEST
jgi:predicted kinase